MFVFRNKNAQRAKILWWDKDGLAIYYKRLEKGTFQFPAGALTFWGKPIKAGSLLEGEKRARRLPMEEHGVLEQIVTRLLGKLKDLSQDVSLGKQEAPTLERQLEGLLKETGRELIGVLLESCDRVLCAKQKVHDRRTRTLLTLFGPVDVTRCRLEKGRYPLDESLGLLGAHAWTGTVQEAAALLGVEKSFESASDLLQRLLTLSISAPGVERISEAAGERALSLLPAKPLSDAAGKVLVIAADGCHAPEKDGWHEVKLATVYANERRVKTASGRGKLAYKE
jgi:hypothetical protein